MVRTCCKSQISPEPRNGRGKPRDSTPLGSAKRLRQQSWENWHWELRFCHHHGELLRAVSCSWIVRSYFIVIGMKYTVTPEEDQWVETLWNHQHPPGPNGFVLLNISRLRNRLKIFRNGQKLKKLLNRTRDSFGVYISCFGQNIQKLTNFGGTQVWLLHSHAMFSLTPSSCPLGFTCHRQDDVFLPWNSHSGFGQPKKIRFSWLIHEMVSWKSYPTNYWLIENSHFLLAWLQSRDVCGCMLSGLTSFRKIRDP